MTLTLSRNKVKCIFFLSFFLNRISIFSPPQKCIFPHKNETSKPVLAIHHFAFLLLLSAVSPETIAAGTGHSSLSFAYHAPFSFSQLLLLFSFALRLLLRQVFHEICFFRPLNLCGVFMNRFDTRRILEY